MVMELTGTSDEDNGSCDSGSQEPFARLQRYRGLRGTTDGKSSGLKSEIRWGPADLEMGGEH